MKEILECRNIIKEYKDKLVLDNINLKIQDGERIGIVGSNGAGKSTLANIITNIIEPTSGEVIWFKENLNIGYMKQAVDIDEVNCTLSGGEKTKKRLNEMFFGNYNMLILDEPTNALDYKGVEFLIERIKKFKGAIIIISHDRYFLDKTINKTIEIEDKKAVVYNGNYTYYREKKKKDFLDALHLYNTQEKERNKIDDEIDNLKKWSKAAHEGAAEKAVKNGVRKGGKEFYRTKAKKKDIAIKSRIKMLEKLKIEGIDKPKEEKTVSFTLRDAQKVGSIVVRAENISKSFDKKVLFEDSAFYVKQGEKVGIYGDNGCGKTTLIKALLGEIEINGELYISSKRKIGYINQDVENFNEDKTILELFNYENRAEQGEIRTKLNLLGFDKESLSKKINVLSLGEKMKLKILMMIENQCDLLILDEPTNHIDLHVREKLEEMLEEYNGTILLITHDRYMLQRICNKMLVFNNKKIQRYEYDFNNYLENFIQKKINNKDENEKCKQEKFILENKISYILSKLSLCERGTNEYLKYDEEFKKLIKIKNEI